LFGILNDREIIRLCEEESMITPFSPTSVKEVRVRDNRVVGALSYGTSSFGYDMRVAEEFRIFNPLTTKTIIDPKNFDLNTMTVEAPLQRDETGTYIILPPHSFCLSRSAEYWKIPDDILAIALDKSTYARCGIGTNITPLEPGWEGHVTLEIENKTPLPAKIYAGEGLIQVLFFRGPRPAVTYRDKKGKYQGQTGITPAKV
jgi:dCTP deaminase